MSMNGALTMDGLLRLHRDDRGFKLDINALSLTSASMSLFTAIEAYVWSIA